MLRTGSEIVIHVSASNDFSAIRMTDISQSWKMVQEMAPESGAYTAVSPSDMSADWVASERTSATKGLATWKIVMGVLVTGAVAGGIAGGVIASQQNNGSGSLSTGPEQVMVTAAYEGADVSHALHVTWVIPYGANATGSPQRASLSPVPPVFNTGVWPVNPRALWGSDPKNLNNMIAADMTSYMYSTVTRQFSNYSSPLLFNATLTGLQPGVPVYYTVGDDANGFSAVYRTLTVPPAGVPNVRWAVIGDLGTTNNSADTLAHIAANHLNPVPVAGVASPFAGVLHIGDLSYADGTQGVWDTYGKLLQPLASTLPWILGIGNHEWFDFEDWSFTSFLKRFRTPSPARDANSLYYSFNSGLFHVVMVQGYCPQMDNSSYITLTNPCLTPQSPQMQWLLADLGGVDRSVTPWVIVTFHQPFMNSNTAHSRQTEGVPIKSAIEQVLYDNAVDLVLSGHVHAYERSCRAYNYACDPVGPTYVTIGDGGNREGLADVWEDPQPAWSLFRQATFGHGELTAVNATHMHWAWHQNPALAPLVADELWLVKGEAGPQGPSVTGTPVFVHTSLRQ